MIIIISNSEQLNDVVNDINTPIEYNIGSFTEKVSSEDYDMVFNNIQNRINVLYEKIRKIQDLHDYTQYYIQDIFKKKSAEFEAITKLLNTATEAYEDIDTVVSYLPFNSCDGIIKDRDGSIIPIADSINGSIVNKSTQLNTASISTVNMISNIVYYKNIPMPVDRYRSFYITEEPVPGGIIEKIDILFDESITINSLDIKCLDSFVLNKYIITHDNEVEEVSDTHFPPKTAKGVRILLSCTSYKTIEVNTVAYEDVEGSISSEKYIQNIKDGIYNIELGLN